MPITLSPETEALWVQVANKRGLDPEELLLTWLDEESQFSQGISLDVDANEHRAWWNSLTDAERQAETESLRASIDAGDAGRVSPAAEVYARVRASVGQIKHIRETTK